ncbi:serine/threonine protein phosphatase 5 [Kipferlia bialata]|uniref:Serine/threonine protein phosphatase 5 n=1 Tax=Kipferlia bialata TaxID=797122 RepID=A0A9K3CT50_9EUKA|nr:serine/threonine protein phosphatase 5 [Kipferlia bialata]|eukprot:g2967.t1
MEVDRGPASLETVLVVLLLALLYPDSVHLTRGNHEEAKTSNRYGLSAECIYRFSDSARPLLSATAVFGAVSAAFLAIPIATLIKGHAREGKGVVCVHGGPPVSLRTLADLQAIDRWTTSRHSIYLRHLLWGDPEVEGTAFPMLSRRGRGRPLYSETDTNMFLAANQLLYMVRAHEQPPDGFLTQWRSRLLTLYSCPGRYLGAANGYSDLLMGGMAPSDYYAHLAGRVPLGRPDWVQDRQSDRQSEAQTRQVRPTEADVPTESVDSASTSAPASVPTNDPPSCLPVVVNTAVTQIRYTRSAVAEAERIVGRAQLVVKERVVPREPGDGQGVMRGLVRRLCGLGLRLHSPSSLSPSGPKAPLAPVQRMDSLKVFPAFTGDMAQSCSTDGLMGYLAPPPLWPNMHVDTENTDVAATPGWALLSPEDCRNGAARVADRRGRGRFDKAAVLLIYADLKYSVVTF